MMRTLRVAVIGLIGAGKTELVKCFAGDANVVTVIEEPPCAPDLDEFYASMRSGAEMTLQPRSASR